MVASYTESFVLRIVNVNILGLAFFTLSRALVNALSLSNRFL